ncbi:MAG: hypothetical protein LRY67_00785 [Gammaproteobacteria bacterium]|nr:hypothetical protein [Gammaproteobacteria bacterium]MCD8542594.1 hypothetical protein [Gammaproteobacteria bacterium]
MQPYYQNECQLVGEVHENIVLRWNKNHPMVEFYLKMPRVESFKSKETQTLRCICKTAHALYIAEKFSAGDRIMVKGGLNSVNRCFEDGFMSEVTIVVKRCYPLNQMEHFHHN